MKTANFNTINHIFGNTHLHKLVFQWADFMKLGDGVPDDNLMARLKGQTPNKCCTLIYTVSAAQMVICTDKGTLIYTVSAAQMVICTDKGTLIYMVSAAQMVICTDKGTLIYT